MSEAPFTQMVSIRLPERIKAFYLKNVKILNYVFVCGIIGVLVSYVSYHVSVVFIWEPIAYYIGVGFGALNNYTFTRGPLDHWFFVEEEKVK